MSLRWEDIRTFNNSQNNAFEELICQLARDESVEKKIDFRRVAAPDGGVEAYCVLDDGTEYGWQAKYFFSMGDSQWKQLKESFEAALKTHPALTKYYICIPMDRQDPRRKDQEWFMDKWNKKVDEWTQYAKSLGRNISIEYWGSHELTYRLSQKSNAGRLRFWFSREELSDSWFRDQIETSIYNLGKRYTPELNIELDIAKNFDAIIRNEKFYNLTHNYFHEFIEKINKLLKNHLHLYNEEESEPFRLCIENIKECFYSVEKELGVIDVVSLNKNLNNISDYVSKFENELRSNNKKNSPQQHRINESWDAISSFSDFINGPILKLANNPVLLLSGDAGMGKSHLLADIANNQIKNGAACVLLLGQHFVSEESPWTQILGNILRFDGKEDELLGALSARAEAQGERILFIIDAINEGKGRYFWPDHLTGLINKLSKYPWVGLVLSIRRSYEKLITPEDFFDEERITRVIQPGFERIEYHACNMFFSQYGIEQPGIPMLHPEFSNPLFLKLFCEGLQRSGLSRIPKGYTGISNIIAFFVKSIESKLSAPSAFDYPENTKLIDRTINKLIEFKINNDASYIPYDAAFELGDEIIGKYSNQRRFIDALISEGVLSKNIYWISKDSYEEGVYLAYERFEDHLTASYLINEKIDKVGDVLSFVFKEQGALYKYVSSSYLYQGIVESFSIQMPERFGKELYELLDDNIKEQSGIIKSFVSSLIWRKPENIEEKTSQYINKVVLPSNEGFDAFIQMIYTVSSDPEHIYNADRLHGFLIKYPMPDRDRIWTVYLHTSDYGISTMQRLIDWAGSEGDKYYLSKESRLLSAKALSWLFTSTNIRLRYTATKALANLLKNNIQTIISLLDSFKNVNDPYVLERIFAAAYGAVLNSKVLNQLDKLSELIVDIIFERDEVYPNVLVRDYARNIVEYAIYKKVYHMDNMDIIRPPYHTYFPNDFPDDEEIDSYKYDYNSIDFQDYYWAQNSILNSMTTEYGRGTGGYGDFGRYTFQSALSNWHDFDPNDLSNYACKLIFDKYGYDVEKLGEFDRNASEGNRNKNKKERIGKKYQWIALYEVLARIADNHQQTEPSSRWSDDKKHIWFQGPWDIFVRNIDPTIPFYSKKIVKKKSFCKGKIQYNDWSGEITDWLKREKNLPKPEDMISILSNDNTQWLLLSGHFSWDEPIPLGVDKSSHSSKCLWYQIKSYLVKESEYIPLLERLNTDPSLIYSLPDISDQYNIFSREYYWSPAYEFFDNPYYNTRGWQDVYADRGEDLPFATVLTTGEGHRWESGLADDEGGTYIAPCELMYHGMALNYSENAGEWLDNCGDIVCLDPSIHYESESSLIVNKEKLQQFLLDNNLKMIWSIVGEKNIHSMHFIEGIKWLEMHGVYTLQNNQLHGELKIKE